MSKKVWDEVGLKKHEYEKIVETLKREPNEVELGMYGAMWSEHCSYKTSKPVLRKFPTEGEKVIQGPGENAGIVDIGDGYAIAMKIESHNHPSAIEPYQGAATGVGGIVRDIFTMGARPIALLNSLRIGELDNERSKYIFGGVVSGISGYGNCLGIPTVGGEVYFSKAYNGNPLVNAMAVGLVKHEDIALGKAAGVGNSVMIVGATTGRDGILGASFASEELSDESEEKRPSVQVGDPFLENLLMEACLELFKTGVVVGVQDLGAAGLTSASCETASRAGNGMKLDVSLIPRREERMTPYEIMLSESQERMLIVVEKGRENEAKKIFDKWDLHAVKVGEVTDDKMLKIYDGDKLAANIPAESLAEGAPIVKSESKEPEYLKETSNLDINNLPKPTDYNVALIKLISSPNICSREWIYTQYDHMVRTDSIVQPGSDSAVIRVRGTDKAIALTTDCNGRYCYLDPYEGGKIAIAEASRNLVCSGAKPLAVTDCLNFGNPEKPEIFWQIEKAIDGISDACRYFDTPVISGNVSLYNETNGKAIYPTPIIGMLGVIDDTEKIVTQSFKRPGDLIILLGENKDEIGGSEYLKVIHDIEKGKTPRLNLEEEKKLQETCLESIKLGIINSAHDISEGGLAAAIAESCISGDLGAKVEVDKDNIREDVLLFGESQSRIIVSINKENLHFLEKVANQKNLKIKVLGWVTEDEDFILDVTDQKGSMNLINLNVKEVKNEWQGKLKCIMD